jgi:hypothetical protein
MKNAKQCYKYLLIAVKKKSNIISIMIYNIKNNIVSDYDDRILSPKLL